MDEHYQPLSNEPLLQHPSPKMFCILHRRSSSQFWVGRSSPIGSSILHILRIIWRCGLFRNTRSTRHFTNKQKKRCDNATQHDSFRNSWNDVSIDKSFDVWFLRPHYTWPSECLCPFFPFVSLKHLRDRHGVFFFIITSKKEEFSIVLHCLLPQPLAIIYA